MDPRPSQVVLILVGIVGSGKVREYNTEQVCISSGCNLTRKSHRARSPRLSRRTVRISYVPIRTTLGTGARSSEWRVMRSTTAYQSV